jgi:hypothetical protein
VQERDFARTSITAVRVALIVCGRKGRVLRVNLRSLPPSPHPHPHNHLSWLMIVCNVVCPPLLFSSIHPIGTAHHTGNGLRAPTYFSFVSFSFSYPSALPPSSVFLRISTTCPFRCSPPPPQSKSTPTSFAKSGLETRQIQDHTPLLSLFFSPNSLLPTYAGSVATEGFYSSARRSVFSSSSCPANTHPPHPPLTLLPPTSLSTRTTMFPLSPPNSKSP